MLANPRRYRLSPLAKDDLEDIWLYTLQNWSLEQADKYQGELIDAIEALAKGHKTGRAMDDVRVSYLKYAVGRHFVFYQITDNYLDVVRILHKQMDVSAHFE